MKSFLPAILCGIAILVLSISPGVNLPENPWDNLGTDKLGHAIAYFTLAGTLYWGISRTFGLTNRSIFLTVAGCIAYGVLVEYLQWWFFPYRYFELYDIISNIIGSVSSLLLLFFIK